MPVPVPEPLPEPEPVPEPAPAPEPVPEPSEPVAETTVSEPEPESAEPPPAEPAAPVAAPVVVPETDDERIARMIAAAAASSLAHFAPRRATLIVVRDAIPDRACGEKTAALAQSIAQLAADRARWRHPVRLLLLQERESGLSGRALAARWMRDLSALGPVAVFEGPSPQLITRPPSMLSD